MKTVLHIGPSKTASTSIQAIIPLLGRPYAVKPDWAKGMVRTKIDTFPRIEVPSGYIISAEIIGDFDAFPPDIISDRVFKLFGSCIIVFVDRDPEERIASLFAQRKKNLPNESYSLDQHRAIVDHVAKKGLGVYASADTERLRKAFAPHDFRVVPFDLLKKDTKAFLKAFCEACEAPFPNVELPHLNAS